MSQTGCQREATEVNRPKVTQLASGRARTGSPEVPARALVLTAAHTTASPGFLVARTGHGPVCACGQVRGRCSPQMATGSPPHAGGQG